MARQKRNKSHEDNANHSSKRQKLRKFDSFKELDEIKNEDFPQRHMNLNFKHGVQRLAWNIYQQHDVLFLLGPAGTGKTHLSLAFAIEEILNRTKKKIVLTRPIVEAGEKLGFLPGDASEKVDPYMMPIWDCMSKICGNSVQTKEIVNNCYEVAPLAFMRGRTFENSVCILDEAQNCTRTQIKLFLTRMGDNSKMIITGDPKQSDLDDVPELVDVVYRLESLAGIGVVYFSEDCIVRHPMVGKILKRLD